MPADRFAASFIGEVNLVPAKARRDGRFDVQASPRAVAGRRRPSAREGDASLAIRPKRLMLSPASPGGANGWEVVVRDRVLIGPTVSFGPRPRLGPRAPGVSRRMIRQRL